MLIKNQLGRFYFLYFILLLHVYTAFLTVINALSDREEILQFSADSFQFVNLDESSNVNIENNINDNEEKELLSVLIKSYDDSQVNSVDVQRSKTNSFSSVRFLPSTLDFSEQSIAIPRLKTFQIINDDAEPLEIYSLISELNGFYSSAISQPTIVPPNGGSLSINIYFLPRTLGLVQTSLIIKTNRANFSYQISGIGIENIYRLRPLIGIEIPPNATYEYTIQFYNPFNCSLNINEIYTSDENLILELLTANNPKNRLTKTFQYHEQWYLQAYETKSIVKINYSALKFDRLIGFICIKTNLLEKIILPIEIHVSNNSGLYSNIDLLELSKERFLRSTNKSIQIPIYALNYGLNSEIITDIRIPSEYDRFLSIQYKTLPIPPSIHRFNQIAALTIDLNSLPESLEQIHGSIDVLTSSNSKLTIPFQEKLFSGSLDWSSDETDIFLTNQTDAKHCRIIQVYNRFRTVISVYNLTIENVQFLSNFIQIQIPASVFHLYPNQWNKLFCLSFLKQPSTLKTFRTQIEIQTNLSNFHIPIHLYNGFVEFEISNDHTNGGIQRSELNSNEFLLTSIPVNTLGTVRFILMNSNPIDIEIKKIQSPFNIELNSIEDFDGNQKESQSNEKNNCSFVLPKLHRANFRLTINGTNPIQFYDQMLTIHTKYQILNIHVKYNIVSNSLELANWTRLQLDVYPNQIGSAEIYLLNKFPMSIQLTRVHFVNYGICFSFKPANFSLEKLVLQSNQIEKIGDLNFDMTPLCKASESNFYCHLNSHPEFKLQWQELVDLLDQYELNRNLIEQFRNLSKNWIQFLKKQTIQTNVWLYSTQTNISLPVTVNFLWPSVIQHTSPTPMTLDFSITCINTTKTQDIMIINPTSNVLSYSIELLAEENSSFSIPENQTLSQFELQPNEQVNFPIVYHPKSAVNEQTYLIIRNNFTIIEPIELIGQGGLGNLQIGQSEFPIILEVSPDHYEFCLNPNGNPVLEKRLTLRNTGNMLTIIHDLSFGRFKCQGQGFSVASCRNIRIEPNEKYNLIILYQPDYTTDEINETMILSTNIGRIVIPISVRIPQRVLSACYRTIPRPPWEIRPYCIGLCTILLSIILVFMLAVFNARKIFDNYLVRAEWRENIQGLNNKIFDLKDLSSAIQDEQKPRNEQPELIQSQEQKKEPKPKRSFNANKTKETAQKTRKSVDSAPAKPTKQTTEVINKIEPVAVIREQKPEETKTLSSTRQISSSTVSEDDENEPFITPRPKRLSKKRKGSLRNSSVESKPTDQQWQVVSSSRGQKKAPSKPSQSTVEDNPTISQTKNSPQANQRTGKSFEENMNQQLAFRQLTEQLWQAGLPTAPTTSIRSRCSSAPPSERGGDADETIDWDEPDTPDEDFGRYTSQNEHSMDDSNEVNDDLSTIPPLMSLNVLQPQPLMSTKSLPVPKENVEPLPFPQRKPGPIQRPINLQFASVFQASSSIFQDSPQSPSTPDVLVQINHLVDRQNSLAQNPSALATDLPTPGGAAWTPFTPNEWSSTWSTTANNQNPFAQRQLSKDDSTLWSGGINMKDSWLKFSPAPESANRQENETNWWPKTSSNENNNTNNNNNNNDHSRWDFAR